MTAFNGTVIPTAPARFRLALGIGHAAVKLGKIYVRIWNGTRWIEAPPS